MLLCTVVLLEIKGSHNYNPKRAQAALAIPLNVISKKWAEFEAGGRQQQQNFGMPSGRKHDRANAGPKIAIIIPYRDRAVHLSAFEDHMHKFATSQFPGAQLTLWIVEQGNDQVFTRGWLGNIGIREVVKVQPDTQCLVFHDVDMVPLPGVPYLECNRPIQLGSELENHQRDDGNWSVPYLRFTGGIVSMSPQHWMQTNGFSNEYIGWGQEDDDLYHRLRMNGLLNEKNCPSRPEPGNGKFALIDEGGDNHPRRHGPSSPKKNVNKQLLFLAWGDRARPTDTWKNTHYWKHDGISNIAYTVVARKTQKAVPGNSLTRHTITVVPDPSFPLPGTRLGYKVEESNYTTAKPSCKGHLWRGVGP